jgi:substrate import-associated zinc metallohydrolase lipoprotein
MKSRNYIINKFKSVAFLGVLATFVGGCYPTEELNVDVKDPDFIPSTALDLYIQELYINEYNMAVRYRFVDNYLNAGQFSTPPKIENVRPMLDFIQEFWIDPYFDVPGGEAFFRKNLPTEIVFLGGFLFNPDGTRTLGFAEAGSRITFTEVNRIDLNNPEWVKLQLNVLFHEFAHIVDQNNDLPPGFENISPEGLTSAGSWFVLTDQEALERGFVSPYSTSAVGEDFAEVLAFYLFDKDFFENFITLEDCTTADCLRRNEGRAKLSEKINSIRDHYENVTGVSLDALREAVQSRLN